MKENIPEFGPQTFKLPDDLYEFQKEDARTLLGPGNWLNFSEMGVGKTPEALAVCELSSYKKVLVVCPNSLRWEWARQIKDWTGETASVSLRAARKRLDNFFFAPTKYYIINYESLRVSRYKDILSKLPWDAIILDEGHKLKNPRALQTKGVSDICRKHPESKILILTGSPILNSPADLYTLLCMVRPSQYTPAFRREFINQYCYGYPTRWGYHITGTRNLDQLRDKTKSFTIRRTKKEVLPYLPEKYYRRPELEMESTQREIYNKMEDELWVMLDSGERLTAPGVLAQLTRLRQLNLEPRILGIEAPSAKTTFLDDLVESFLDDGPANGQKAVVFSCFSTYIHYLDIRYKDIPHIKITGEENTEQRMRNVTSFQNDPNIKLALGTIQVMGEGITLTAASNCIMTDLWWSPAVNLQAQDRLHRIGQHNPVQVIIPECLDSIDQSLHTILKRKEEFAAGYFGDESIITETIRNRRETK